MISSFFPLFTQNDVVRINGLTMILKIIGQYLCDAELVIMLSIKTIASLLKVST